MTSKPWQTKEFQALQSEWYERLKKEGFDDHEKGEHLIQRSSNSYRQAPLLIRESKLEYYRQIMSYVNTEVFPKERDKIIMTLLSQGYSRREICDALRELNYNTDRHTVVYTIRGYEHKWNIRHWTRRQLFPPSKHHGKQK